MSGQRGIAWVEILFGLIISSVFLLLMFGLTVGVKYLAGPSWAGLVPALFFWLMAIGNLRDTFFVDRVTGRRPSARNRLGGSLMAVGQVCTPLIWLLPVPQEYFWIALGGCIGTAIIGMVVVGG